MHNDEQEIHQLVATWMAATKAGDIETVFSKWLLARHANMLNTVSKSGG